MREGCKRSGYPRSGAAVRGSGGVGKIPTGVGQHGGDDEADRRGPRGIDRGRRRPAREGVI
jgi:hypothetical protein